MIHYARQLGADCAFFIRNKPVFAFEKGDEFEPIKLDLSQYSIVLVMPEIHVSTSEAYSGRKTVFGQRFFNGTDMPAGYRMEKSY